jgi:hypothetical protein
MYTTIHIAAPEGTRWPLDMTTFSRRLGERLPGVNVHTPKRTAVGDADYVPFESEIDGETRHGLYADGTQLILEDGTPEFWSATIVWFLGLLPAGSGAVALVDVNPEEIAPIPSGADAEAVEEVLNRLADVE